MNLFYRFWNSFFRFFFKIIYRHKVYGLENLPQGAAILAPNHTSFFDPPLVGISCPEEVHFLAKAVLFESKILGPIIRRLNAHPVSGTFNDLKSIKMICHLIREGKKVVIFPEGIRSWDGKQLPVKSGIGMIAQRAGAPIVPIYLKGVFEIWPRTKKFPRLFGSTTCIFGKPIYPQNFEHLPKKEAQQAIASAVQNSIADLKTCNNPSNII